MNQPSTLRRSGVETMAPSEIGRVSYTSIAAEIEALEARERPAGVDFEAILYPNRSLPSAGFAAVMAIVIVVNLGMGIGFYALGAWPVVGFCGLDVLLVWLAFKISYRQGRLHERVRLGADGLSISRVLPSGHETRWRLEPYWTRVEIVRPGDHLAEVRIVNKGRMLLLGAFLSPKERTAFGERLRDALAAHTASPRP